MRPPRRLPRPTRPRPATPPPYQPQYQQAPQTPPPYQQAPGYQQGAYYPPAGYQQPPYQQQPYRPGYPGGTVPNIPSYLGWAIATLILCFWPTGIVAIVYATKVGNLLAVGDVYGAQEASQQGQDVVLDHLRHRDRRVGDSDDLGRPVHPGLGQRGHRLQHLLAKG